MALKSIFSTHIQPHYVIRTKNANNSQLPNAEKSCTMQIDFLKMPIDTGIPLDKSLVQLLEPNQNVMLVLV